MISIVAAMTKQRVIGNDDKLPWHIDSEIKHFRDIIRGKTIILGRRTFDVMKGSLQSSHTIVVTHSNEEIQGASVCENLEEALAKARGFGPDIFIIGGQSIFEQAVGFADTMQLSFVKKDYGGNKFFPNIDMDKWEVASREDFPDFEYVVYVRKKSSI